MRPIPVPAWFFAGMVIGVIGISILSASPFWYLTILLLLPVGGVFFLLRNQPDRVFYGVCASQPLIIACGQVNLWAGLFVVWMVAGIAAGMLDLLVSQNDLSWLLLFFGSTFLIAGVTEVSGHVVSLLLLLGAGLALVLAVLVIRDYQFRKHYSGAGP
jgi:hypothetical protein